MGEHRTQLRIVNDILTVARDDVIDAHGMAVTRLSRHANVPHARLTGILSLLVSHGLLERGSPTGAYRYKISDSGREFLVAYRTFSEFAEGFGLSL